jgi:hypothetical protein
MAKHELYVPYTNEFTRNRQLHLHAIKEILSKKDSERYPKNDVFSWDSLSTVPPTDIADCMDAMLTDIQREQNQQLFESQVAPKELIVCDFMHIANEKLHYLSKRERYDICARAIQGHAHEGHGKFQRKRFVNTTTLDVIQALHSKRLTVGKKEAFAVDSFQRRTQRWIDSIVTTLDDFFDNPHAYVEPVVLTKKAQVNFSRLGWMVNQPVQMLELIRGFYFASKMDNYGMRSQVQQKYHCVMGGGECVGAHMHTLAQYSATLSSFATMDYPRELHPLSRLKPDKRMDVLRELNIIVEHDMNQALAEKKVSWNLLKEHAIDTTQPIHCDIQTIYVRSQVGPGVSDDIALVLASQLPSIASNGQQQPHDGSSRFIGAVFADLIDTLEKDSHLVFSGGQDDIIGTYFAKRFDALCKKSPQFRKAFNIPTQSDVYELVSHPVLIDFIAASANSPQQEIHSSQRYFHKDIHGTCALNQYFIFMHNVASQYGLPFHRCTHTPNQLLNNTVPLTFSRIQGRDIYHEMGKRISLVRVPYTRERKLTEFHSSQK